MLPLAHQLALRKAEREKEKRRRHMTADDLMTARAIYYEDMKAKDAEIERLTKDLQDTVVDAEILQLKVLQRDAEIKKLRELISRSIEYILGDCSGMTEMEGTSDDALARDTYANAAELLTDMLPYLDPREVQMLGLEDEILKLRNWAAGG